MEKYEEDLRDQWQSHAHREEWRRFLRLLIETHTRDTTPVTVLSGEIHLATRGTMDTPEGPLHQLVASGISHPAPPTAYATALSLLARFGEAPLPEHPISLHPLPGRRSEERRVGKECVSKWSTRGPPYHTKKQTQNKRQVNADK